MLRRPANRSLTGGFTLIELMVTITLLAILLGLAMPSFSAWVRNSKLRAVGDSLQNGLRLAQAEALRRNRQVVFTLTNAKVDASNAASHTAVANGNYWALSTVAAYTNDSVAFIESGVMNDVASGVRITGPASICFNAMGRIAVNADPGISGANCALPTTSPAVLTFNVDYADSVAGQDRPMRVTVALGGQVRMCDPAKSLASGYSDGC